MNVLCCFSPPVAGVPVLPIPLDELGEVAAGHPHTVSTGQQPQDGDLIQQLPHKAECHVEIHGEQTCRKAEARRGCQEEGPFPEHFPASHTHTYR